MQIWIVVVALLVLAVLFLFISLFLKDYSNDEELEEMSENLLKINREIYHLKKKIQELENSATVTYADDVPVETSYDYTSPSDYTIEFPDEYQERAAYQAEPTPVQENHEPAPLHNITKQHIITLYSHGSTVEEIAEELAIPAPVVQSVVNQYFDNNQ